MRSVPGRPTTTVGLEGTRGPGTVLFAGLKVQPGSRLVGTAYPVFSNEGSPGAQGALVIVDADPSEVFSDYVEALESDGYAFGPTTCVGRGPVGAVQCVIATDSATAATGSVTLTLVAPAAAKRDFSTTIAIELTPLSSKPLDASSASIGAASAIASARARAVRARVTPGVGDRIAPQGVDGDRTLEVVDGIELITPAVPTVPTAEGGGGWTAIARVTGNPQEVREAILAQGPWDSTDSSEMSVGGAPLLLGTATAAGDGDLRIVLVSVPGESDAKHEWFLVLNRHLD